MKRYDNKTSYLIDNYLITIWQNGIDKNGNGMYEAILTNLKEFKDWEQVNAIHYRFKTSYCGLRGEAKKILEYHLSKIGGKR